EERADWSVIKEKIRVDLKRYISKQTSKRPLILPVILRFDWRRRGTVTPRPGRGRRRSQRTEHREHREESSNRKRREVVTSGRRSPPVAENAKGGAPSSTSVGGVTRDTREKTKKLMGRIELLRPNAGRYRLS